MEQKRIKVISTARNKRGTLFAIGERKNEFYFITPPKDDKEREYFDRIYHQVVRGRKVTVQADIMDRMARLVAPEISSPSRLEAIADQTPTLADVDLYSIIHPADEDALLRYVADPSYHKKREALKDKVPQKILQEDKLSRDIVKAILEHGSQEPLTIFGRDAVFGCGYEHILFPKISDPMINDRLYNLRNKGLVARSFDPSILCHWAFESEYKIDSASGICNIQATFVPNQTLREEIKRMLQPFEAEPVSYRLIKPDCRIF